MGGQVQMPPVPAKLLLDRRFGRGRAGQDQGLLLGEGRAEELGDAPHFRLGAGQGPEARAGTPPAARQASGPTRSEPAPPGSAL